MPASSKKKKKISPKLSALIVTKKNITPLSIPRKKMQKTIVGLSNFYISDWN